MIKDWYSGDLDSARGVQISQSLVPILYYGTLEGQYFQYRNL